MFKYTFAILIFSTFTLALDNHHPKVHEDIEETLQEVSKKIRRHEEKYKPPVFVYDKTVQPDLRKWRYFQQQKVDSRNGKKNRELLELINASQNNQPLYKIKDQSPSKNEESPIELVLEPRWKVIHQNFVTEKRNEFPSSVLIRMPEQYGRRKSPSLMSKSENSNQTSISLNIEDGKKSHYMVEEDDLDIAASENKEYRIALDRQDQLTATPPHSLPQNAHMFYINPIPVAEPFVRAASPVSLSGTQYSQQDQKDIDALNSLLGKNPIVQINGLKQLLHSQTKEVVPFTNSGSQVTPVSNTNEKNVKSQLVVQPTGVYTDANSNQIQSQNNLQANVQTLEELQNRLDAISRRESEKAIADAQRKTLEYVKSQQEAIELAEIKGRQLAIATIKAHNLQLAEPLPQSLHLIQSQESPQYEENTQIKEIDPGKAAALPEASTTFNSQQSVQQQPLTEGNEGMAHVQHQTQPYLHLASQHYTSPKQEIIQSGAQTQDQYTFTHPEVNHNGVNTFNVQQLLQTQNSVHAQLQAEAYKNLAIKAYSQNREELQDSYVTSVKPVVSSQPVHEDGHDDEYAPKYAFGYRVLDYQSGVNYGHEESRDDKVTKGKYHVHLPDGRVQNVNYWADINGYHAKVTYSNVAQH